VIRHRGCCYSVIPRAESRHSGPDGLLGYHVGKRDPWFLRLGNATRVLVHSRGEAPLILDPANLNVEQVLNPANLSNEQVAGKSAYQRVASWWTAGKLAPVLSAAPVLPDGADPKAKALHKRKYTRDPDGENVHP
jgi:hypothetical protein